MRKREHRLRFILGVVLLGFVFSILGARRSEAIPVFARKYRTTCNTCHVAIPKLRAFGEAFRLNGYRMPVPEGDDVYVKEEPVSLGAPAWKRVWPDAVWPSSIPSNSPFAVRILNDFKVNARSADDSTEFDFPHEVELFYAAVLGEKISVFGEIEFEHGTEALLRENAVQFNDILDRWLPENAFNIRVGQINTNVIPSARDKNRLGKEHFLYGDWKMSLTGSDNGWRSRDSTPGVAANGIIRSRFAYNVGVVNGSGVNAGGTGDDNDEKDLFGVVRYKFGGMGYDGSLPDAGDEGSPLLTEATDFWVDNAVEISAFGYSGTANVTGGEEEDFTRAGISGRWTWKNLDLFGGYIVGENDDPWGTDSTEDADSQTWFVQGEYVIYPWLIGLLRYESLEVDRPSSFASIPGWKDADRSRFVPALIIQARANVKITLEGVIYDDFDDGDDDSPDTFAVRLDVAF